VFRTKISINRGRVPHGKSKAEWQLKSGWPEEAEKEMRSMTLLLQMRVLHEMDVLLKE
jgi:hypothetical protein